MSRTDEALAEERERRGWRRMTSGRRIWRPRRRRLFRRLAGGVEAHTQFTSRTRTERLELEQSICSFSTRIRCDYSRKLRESTLSRTSSGSNFIFGTTSSRNSCVRIPRLCSARHISIGQNFSMGYFTVE
jgi:hypothetical protein